MRDWEDGSLRKNIENYSEEVDNKWKKRNDVVVRGQNEVKREFLFNTYNWKIWNIKRFSGEEKIDY